MLPVFYYASGFAFNLLVLRKLPTESETRNLVLATCRNVAGQSKVSEFVCEIRTSPDIPIA